MKNLLITFSFLSIATFGHRLIAQESKTYQDSIDWQSIVNTIPINSDSAFQLMDDFLQKLDGRYEYDLFDHYAREVYKLAVRHGSEQENQIAIINMARAMVRQNRYDSAQFYYLKSIAGYERQHDSLKLGKAFCEYSNVLIRGFDDVDGALDAVLKSIRIFESIGDSAQLMTAYFNQAYVISSAGQKEESRAVYDVVQSYAERHQDSTLMFEVYQNKASVYYELYEDSLSYAYHLKARALGNRNPQFWTSLLIGLASSSAALGYFEESEKYYLEAEEYSRKVGDSVKLINVYQGLTYLHKLQGDQTGQHSHYQTGEAYAKRAYELSRQLGLKSWIELSLQGYILIYESTGDYEQAFERQTERIEIVQEINRERMKDRYAKLKTEFETEKKDAENRQLQADNRQQKWVNQLLIIGASVLLFLSAMLFFLYDRVRKSKIIIEKQSDELKRLNDLKSEFFANISHELRTPITLIQGNLSVLEKDHLDDIDRKQKANNARRNTMQLKYMVEDLLDLSKLELGQYEFHPQQVVFNSFIRRVVSSFQSLSDERRTPLRLISTISEVATVNIDPRQFEKVISNLLYNAFKFSPPQKEILVSVEENEDRLIINVRDQGSGIAPVDLPHIFDRFYRTRSDKNEQGTGLGLAIVKEIIDYHKGEIEVTSKPGQGADFRISIAKGVDRIDATDLESVDLPSSRQIVKENLLQYEVEKPRVLLVEDNTEMQQFLMEILGEIFNVSLCKNGAEALKWLKKKRPDLIISDVMMPEMDGFELLEHLKKDLELRQLPVILLTAKSSNDDRLRALRLGVDDFVTKPFDQDELLIKASNLIVNLRSRIRWASDQQEESQVSTDESSKVSQEDEELIHSLQQYILDHIKDEELSIRDLAVQASMSLRQLYRKLSATAGLTPNDFIIEVRLQQARKLLLAGKITKLSHLAAEVGFTTPAYLTKQFYKRFGKKPNEYY